MSLEASDSIPSNLDLSVGDIKPAFVVLAKTSAISDVSPLFYFNFRVILSEDGVGTIEDIDTLAKLFAELATESVFI